jgi:other hect domain ubiquitin protein ligase E3
VIRPSLRSPLHLELYRFLGRLMGAALTTGVLVTLDLPSLVWKPLVGQPLDGRDLWCIDRSLLSLLKLLSNSSREQLEELCTATAMTFTTTLTDKSRALLLAGGDRVPVTWHNRVEYCRLAEQARLDESRRQTHALRQGLSDVVPEALLQLCTWRDLEWRVAGRPHIDVELLRRHTTCSGVSPDAPHVQYLWQVLREFSQEERRAFLRFVWAQERLPASDEEFERGKVRMMIKPYTGDGSNPNNAFPKADTCFLNLQLPQYSSAKILRDKLLQAIFTDSHSMDADGDVTSHPPGEFDIYVPSGAGGVDVGLDLFNGDDGGSDEDD